MKIFLLLFLVSCAKVSYIAEQGIGQLALEYNDIDVENFVEDKSQKKSHIEKVKLIQKAKKYFFNYFDLEEVDIYDEVKILDQEAVTYLVIHSPANKIKAISTSFPIVGSFPYLGFFSKTSANEFKKEKEGEGFHTYMRPVYAYSTLNHPLWPFDDNILSSFFYYKDKALVELIFHELVHTVLFVGDNVSFNENLAQFIAERMVLDYFQISQSTFLEMKMQKEKSKKLNQVIVDSTKQLNEKYKLASSEYDSILKMYLKESFIPKVKKHCDLERINNCWPLRGEWNNARIAAFGTYESKRNELEEIYTKSRLSLKNFVLYMIKKEKDYDEDEQSFLEFIKKELKK